MTPVLELVNVSRVHGSGPTAVHALRDVTLTVSAGELVAVMGPSGSGKSTLLRIVAGLEQADTGSVVIAGEDVTPVPPQKRGIGFVFQHYAAFKHMTVRDNVAFGLAIRREKKPVIRARIRFSMINWC